MSEFKKICKVGDLAAGKCKGLTIEGQDVGLYNIDGQFYAMEDMCPHQGAPLSQGFPKGDIVTCPWHMWRFNVKDGKSLTAPGADLRTFEVKVEGDDVMIKL